MTLRDLIQARLKLPDTAFDAYKNDLFVKSSLKVKAFLKNHYPAWENIQLYKNPKNRDTWLRVPGGLNHEPNLNINTIAKR